MIVLQRLVTTVLLLAAIAGQAQESPSSASELQAQLDTIETDLVDLRQLAEVVPTLSGSQKEAMAYRLDARLLRVLRQSDELASKLSKLPPDNPLISQLREKVLTDFHQVSIAIFGRLEELDARITQGQNDLAGQSGVDRIERLAHLDVFDSLRERYLAAMARHLQVRAKLGLDNEELQPRVERLLRLRAEALAGGMVMMSTLAEEYRRRRSGEGNRADLDTLLAQAVDRRVYLLQGLRTVTNVMNSIGMDTRDYQSLLVREEGISAKLFERDVFVRLAEEWSDAVKAFAANRGPDLLLNIILFLVIIVMFRILARLASRLVRAGLNRSRANFSQLLKNTAVSLSGGLVMLFGILVALSQIGLSVGPMLAGLGIAGFIIGFALQDTLGNFASGAMILIYRPFDVDDFVEVTGASGVVKRMNLVSTTITTFDNQTLVVPNSKIWGDVIKNVTHQKLRRVDLEFGIGYQDDIAKAERILAEAAADHELVLDKPETNVKVHSLGDSSVNLILRPWVKTENYWTVYWDLIREVKLRFDREGVTIPFPQRDVHLYHQETDADS
jgi:small conductance mechanosensitive channel